MGAKYMEPHIASTYAAICTIVNLECEEAYSIINTSTMTDFLLQIKNTGAERPQPIPSTPPNTTPLHSLHKCVEINTAQIGGFEIHVNGENDLRACYCALVVADILNILSQENAQILKYRLSTFIASCQTYEGGIYLSFFYFLEGLAAFLMGKRMEGIRIVQLLLWLCWIG
jgi:protein farnesyltransferase subunit beta